MTKFESRLFGAGATGVELAAELRHASQQMAYYGVHNIHAENVEIAIIEASERILPALPERISKAAGKQLDKIGVQVLTNHLVEEVNDEGLVFKDKGQLQCSHQSLGCRS